MDYFCAYRNFILNANPVDKCTIKALSFIRFIFNLRIAHIVAILNATHMLDETDRSVFACVMKSRDTPDDYGLLPSDYLQLCRHDREPFDQCGFIDSYAPMTTFKREIGLCIIDMVLGKPVNISNLKLVAYNAGFPIGYMQFMKEIKILRKQVVANFKGQAMPQTMPIGFMINCTLSFKHKKKMYDAIIEVRGGNLIFNDFCDALNDRIVFSTEEFYYIVKRIIAGRDLSCVDRMIMFG